MILRFSVVGAALLGSLAIGATFVSGAQASPMFQSSSYPATVRAHSAASNHVLTINKGPMKCNTHNFEATLNEASSTLTVTPHYTGCTWFGGLNATPSMNGCHYLLHLDTDPGNAGPQYTGDMDIVCPAGKKIVLKSLQCTLEIGTQNGLGEVLFENVEGGSLAVQFNISGFSYTTAGSCGASSPSNGTYVGNSHAEALNEAEEPLSLFIE